MGLKDKNEIIQSLENLAKFVVYPKGYTLLSYLAKKNNTKLIREVFQFDDIKFVRDISGNTPLNYALAKKNFEAINLMLEFICKKPELINTMINQNELT